MHVRFPPSPLASIPRAHKGISWLPHPASAMSFLKSTFLKGTLITTTQSLQVMKIATALYLFFIYFYLEDNCFAMLHWLLPYDNVNRLLSFDEMVGWNHQLNGHESEQTPGVRDGRRPGVLQSMGSQRVRHD